MKIQGVDPVIMNRIQEKVKSKAVQDSKQAQITDGRRQEEKGKEERRREEDLAAAVKKLNAAAEALGICLAFLLGDEDKIFVIDRETQQLIGELPPGNVTGLLADMKSFVGMMVDQLI